MCNTIWSIGPPTPASGWGKKGQVDNQVGSGKRLAPRTMLAPFDSFAENTGRISTTCLLNFDRDGYCVECRYAGEVATVPPMPSASC